MRVVEILHFNFGFIVPGGPQRCLIDQVLDVGTRHAGRCLSHDLQINIGGQGNVPNVNFEDRQAARFCGAADRYVSIKASRPKQRRIENVRAIGCGDNDDRIVGLKTIHLAKDLIQGLLAFIVSTSQSGTSLATDCVDFVDEDDCWRLGFGRGKQIPDSAGTDTHEHLDEFTTVDAEVGHVRFAGDGAGEQCFSGSGRADQQRSFGDTSTQFLEFGRVLEELNNFVQICLYAFQAGDVLERNRFGGGFIFFGRAAEKFERKPPPPII